MSILTTGSPVSTHCVKYDVSSLFSIVSFVHERHTIHAVAITISAKIAMIVVFSFKSVLKIICLSYLDEE